jgi:hypothetical protein
MVVAVVVAPLLLLPWRSLLAWRFGVSSSTPRMARRPRLKEWSHGQESRVGERTGKAEVKTAWWREMRTERERRREKKAERERRHE